MDTTMHRNHSETQLENLDGDTEVLDIPDCIKDVTTQMSQLVDDYEEEVVPDSDDEQVYKTGMASFKKLSSDKSNRTAGGVVLSTRRTPYVHNDNILLPPVASACRQDCVGLVRSEVNSVWGSLAQHCPTDKVIGIGHGNIHADAYSQKQFATGDNRTFGLEDSSSVNTQVTEAVKDSESWECNGNLIELKDETKGRDVLTKISTRNMLHRNKLSETECEASDGEKDIALPTSEHKTTKLSYNESQEPGELSQTSALGFVDHYLSLNSTSLFEEVTPTKISRQKSPPVLCAKGPLSLARKAILGTTFGRSGTFEWDDDQHDDGEGNFLEKKMDLILNDEGHEPIFVTGPQSAGNMNSQRQRNLDVQCKEKLLGMGAGFSNSSSIVPSSKEVDEVAQVPEMKFVKEIDDQLNVEASGQQLEAGDIGRVMPDIFDAGFDTQMAAEAMEALFYAPFPNSNDAYAQQDPVYKAEDSPKCETGIYSFSTRVCSNSGVNARKLKQTNGPLKKLSGNISNSVGKNTKNKEVLDPELPEVNRAKKGKSLAETNFNSGRPTSTKKHSCKSSFKLHLLKENVDPINSSGQGTSKVMEVSFSKKRRKNGQNADTLQGSSVRGKRPKIVSHIPEEATNAKVNQQAQKEPNVVPSGSDLKLDVWSYPRGKRTHRKVPFRSKGVSNICLPSTLVMGEKGNKHSLQSHKKSLVSSEISCFSMDVRRKPRSSLYARQVRPSLVNRCKESFSKQRSDELSLPDVHCGSGVISETMTPLDRIEASRQSQELDKNIKLKILSNGNGRVSLSKISSPVNFTEGLNLAPAIHKAEENCKQLCYKKISRFPLAKELISLGISRSLPNTASKDIRKRRHMATVRVWFSQNLDDDIIKHQKKLLARLGSSIASCCSDATHFIADRFVRTKNMLEAIGLGKPVVTHLWLDSCWQTSCYIDEKNYILRDAKKEKEIGFSMPISLARARQHPLLKGRRVFVTPNVKPGNGLVANLVKAVRGQALDSIDKAAMRNEMIPDDLLILSCEQDYALCAPFLEKGAAVYSSELLLNGIIIQKLEFERHRLFKTMTRVELKSLSHNWPEERL